MELVIERPPRADEDLWASDLDLLQLDLWLAAHSEPIASDPIVWGHSRRTLVSDAEHLGALIGGLGKGEFGIARSAAGGGRWGQVMNVASDHEVSTYIAEVHDGTPSDFAQRVFRGVRFSDYPESPAGPRDLHDFEVFGAPVVAEILWSFLHVGLPIGYLRTLRYLGPAERRRYGLPQ